MVLNAAEAKKQGAKFSHLMGETFVSRSGPYLKSFRVEYAKRQKEMESESAAEHHAARVVQKTWRGLKTRYIYNYTHLHLTMIYVSRQAIQTLKDKAEAIQKSLRDFNQRRKEEAEIQAMLKLERFNMYNVKATLIQKIWRGHILRKSHSFAARKAYIAKVTENVPFLPVESFTQVYNVGCQGKSINQPANARNSPSKKSSTISRTRIPLSKKDSQ